MRPMSEILDEAGAFFMHRSPVYRAVARITRRLEELEIPYVVVGALAVNAHGLKRMTEDVDLLLTREGLERFKRRWLGVRWTERFPGSKGLRDAEDNVKIDVLLTGDYPGDGKPKSVVFPDPATLDPDVTPDGWRVIDLRRLLEFKIASAMTAPHRPRDFDDAIRLIAINRLPEQYEIDPYVRDKYRELWALAQIRDEE